MKDKIKISGCIDKKVNTADYIRASCSVSNVQSPAETNKLNELSTQLYAVHFHR